MAKEPLVSIGVPVRNGERYLAEALDLLVNQTYRNIEIIVSNNNSNDASFEIAQRFARLDNRIRMHQQSRTLTAFENFRFVFEKCRGEFFMWAACDDRRSLDFVERMLAELQRRPDASLAFGEVAEYSDGSNWRDASVIPYMFETEVGASTSARLIRYLRLNCLQIYGLIRSSALASYEWMDIDNGPDIPLLVHLAITGEFVRASGGCFYYYVPPVAKSLRDRAKHNSLSPLRPFPELRLAWACAVTARRSGRQNGRPIMLPYAFIIGYATRHWRWIKPRIFAAAPPVLVGAYRRWCKRGRP